MDGALYIEDRDDNPDKPFKLSNFFSKRQAEEEQKFTDQELAEFEKKNHEMLEAIKRKNKEKEE